MGLDYAALEAWVTDNAPAVHRDDLLEALDLARALEASLPARRALARDPDVLRSRVR